MSGREQNLIEQNLIEQNLIEQNLIEQNLIEQKLIEQDLLSFYTLYRTSNHLAYLNWYAHINHTHNVFLPKILYSTTTFHFPIVYQILDLF